MRSHSLLRLVTGLFLALAVACAGSGAERVDPEGVESEGASTPSGDSSSASADTSVPTTSAEWLEAHARWVAEMLTAGSQMPPAAEMESRFAQSFRDAVPIASVRAGFLQLGAGETFTATTIEATDERTLESLVAADGGPFYRVYLVVDPETPQQLTGLRLAPAPELDPSWEPAPSWEALDAELQAYADRVGFLAAEIVEDGSCRPIHGIAHDTPFAVGSAFKLYVLAALADSVYAEERAWDELLAIREDWKSLPTGRMHNEAAETTFSLREYAEAMISISDNTATDHLLRTLGREAVEATVGAAGHHDPARLIPFMATADMFTLKLLAEPDVRERFLAGDAEARRAILDTELTLDRGTALFAAGFWTAPRALPIEWYVAPSDVCSAYAYLAGGAVAHDDFTVLEVLAINPVLALDESVWSYVGYKGGSEPGVLNYSWLLRRSDDRAFVVTVSFNDDEEALTDIAEPALLSMRSAARLLEEE